MIVKFDVGDWVLVVRPKNISSQSLSFVGMIEGPVPITSFQSNLDGKGVTYSLLIPGETAQENELFTNMEEALVAFKAIVGDVLPNLKDEKDSPKDKVAKVIAESASKRKNTIHH